METFAEYTDVFDTMLSYCFSIETFLLSITSKKLYIATKYIKNINIKPCDIAFYGIEYSNTNIIDVAINMGYILENATAIYAAKHKSMKIIQYLINKSCPMNEDVTTFGASDINIFKYLIEHNVPHNMSAHCVAISGNDIEFVKWLFDTYPVDIKFNNHKNINNLDIYKYLYINGYVNIESFINNYYYLFCKNQYDILEWMYNIDKNLMIEHTKTKIFAHSLYSIKWYFNKLRGLSIEDEIINNANKESIYSNICQGNNEDLILTKLNLISSIIPINISITSCLIIVRKKYMKIINWLIKKNALVIDSDIFAQAISYELPDFVNYLISINYPINQYVFESAILQNDPILIKYMQDNNCPFDDDTYSIAASNGNIDLLKWFKERGAIFNNFNLCDAVSSRNTNCIDYIYDNMDLNDFDVTDVFITAISTNNIQILDYLVNKFDIDYDLQYFYSTHSAEVIIWLLEHVKYKPHIDINMVYNDRIDLLKIYREHKCEYSKDFLDDVRKSYMTNCYIYAYNDGMRLVNNDHINSNDLEKKLLYVGPNCTNCMHGQCRRNSKCKLRALKEIEHFEQSNEK
jgi:hypothetical protein